MDGVAGVIVLLLGGFTVLLAQVRLRRRSREAVAAPPPAAEADEVIDDRDGRFQRTCDDEIARLAIALVENGVLERDELEAKAGALHWGPGRFAEALSAAEREGHIERVGHDRFAAPMPRYSRPPA